jgi:heptosyltransferase-2
MPKILFIRGGAIGDFVLTLPAIGLVRDAFPKAQIEVMGYRHILALADGRHYVDATRSIEYAPMAGFFSRNNDLDKELVTYFGSFQQVISYLYDPDGLFEANLRRCGVKHLISANPIATDGDHAARQLARPLEKLALYLEDHAVTLRPSESDFADARAMLHSLGIDLERQTLIVHPGSGSAKKNWPAEKWSELMHNLRGRRPEMPILIVGGEADAPVLKQMRAEFGAEVPIVTSPSLPVLAAMTALCGFFAGHDSGVSHIAAGAGAQAVLLYGPTDPDVWAPANPGVRVIRAPDQNLANLGMETVSAAMDEMMGMR